MSRRRLLIVHDALAGWGSEKNLCHFGEFADRERFEISYLLTMARPAPAESGPQATRVYFLGTPRIRANQYSQPVSFLVKLALTIGWLRKRRGEFDYLIGSNAEECVIAFLASRLLLFDCRLVFYSQIPLDLAPANLFQGWILRSLTAIAKRVDGLICLSQGLCNHLSTKHGVHTRMHVMPSCIDLGRIEALSREAVEEAWLLQDRRRTVAFVGRLSNRQKRVDVLLEAIALLRTAHGADPIRALIIGDGEDRGKLEQQSKSLGLEGQVYFLGYQSNPYKYCALADLFVLSSDVEGFGNVIIEAMACGLPVISTDCETGPAEILEGGKWGVLVPTGNPALLAEKIHGVLKNEELRQDLKRRSLARARDFECRKVFGKFTAIFEDIDRAANARGFA